tara:strand:+ start:545 stop:1603 length:1059 start_codon:yes stop_codon:yes gene_type:complete
MKKTFLYKQHIANKAKMIAFSGWSMPINYGSQLKEHNYVRQSVGIFDVSHMSIFKISGEKELNFLEKIFANDINKIYGKDKGIYGLLLNESAGIIDDLIIYHIDNTLFMVSNCATKSKVESWLKLHAERFNVKIEYQDRLGILAIQGPLSSKIVLEITARTQSLKPFDCIKTGNLVIARTGYTGEDGFEIIGSKADLTNIWVASLKMGVMPIGLGARDTLRLEAGFCLYGTDMDDNTSPYEANLAWTVDTTNQNRNFIGKKKYLNLNKNKLQEITGVILKDKGVLRNGYKIKHDNGLGKILSGTFSPTLQQSIALARVDPDYPPQGKVLIRDKELEVEFVSPQFIKRDKITA